EVQAGLVGKLRQLSFAVDAFKVFEFPVFAGQQSCCQGEVWEDRQVVLLGNSTVAVCAFNVAAVCQRVVRLDSYRNGEVFFFCRGDPGVLALWAQVRYPNVAGFAVFDQAVEGPCQLLSRLGFVIVVGVGEIDPVCLQPFQRAVDSCAHVDFGQARVFVQTSDLGRKKDSVAVAVQLQDFAHYGFGFATAITGCRGRVAVGSIYVSTAGIQKCVEDCKRFLFVGGPPECVTTQCQG